MDYKFINKIDTEKKEAEMLLYGGVGEEIDGNYIAKEIQYLEEQGITKITQRINSGGGSVINGLSVVSANLNAKAKIHTINDGICASMAGIILMTGDKVSMADYSLLMIHEPSLGWERIDTTTDDKVKRGLIAIRDQLSKIIQNRSGKAKDDVDAIMNKESWYTAVEAQTNGFIDNIIEYAKKPNINNTMSIDDILMAVNQFKGFTNNKNNFKMEKLINHFNLEAEASIEDVLAKVQEIEAQKEEIVNKLEIAESTIEEKENAINELSEKVEVLETEKVELTENATEKETILKEVNDELITYKEKEVSNYVEQCITTGLFKDTDKAELIEEANADFGAFKKLVNKMKIPHVNILGQLEDVEEDERANWTHEDWQKNDPKGLAEMKASNPDKEKELYDKCYINAKK